jgi:hypothetical protein
MNPAGGGRWLMLMARQDLSVGQRHEMNEYQFEPTNLLWNSDGEFSWIYLYLNEPDIRLTVEKLPNGGWEWVVWCNSAQQNCRHGTCDSRDSAICLAGKAALGLRQFLKQPYWVTEAEAGLNGCRVRPPTK